MTDVRHSDSAGLQLFKKTDCSPTKGPNSSHTSYFKHQTLFHFYIKIHGILNIYSLLKHEVYNTVIICTPYKDSGYKSHLVSSFFLFFCFSQVNKPVHCISKELSFVFFFSVLHVTQKHWPKMKMFEKYLALLSALVLFKLLSWCFDRMSFLFLPSECETS